MTTNISSLANLIWSVADLLRGDFKQSQYMYRTLSGKRINNTV